MAAPAATGSIRIKRLDADERALADLHSQVSAAGGSVAEVEAQMKALKSSLCLARDWLDDVTRRRDALQASVTAQRMATRPFSTIPPETLGCILLQYVCSYDADWRATPDGVPYSKERTRAPFIVASVSKQWRRVALDTPRLWSYCGVPRLSSAYQGEAVDKRLRLIVKKSRAGPLDISFESLHSKQQALYATIFATLRTHARRWRRLYVSISGNLSFPQLLESLEGPTPRLEELCLVQLGNVPSIDVVWPDSPPVYLTAASRLAFCRVRSLPLAVTPRHVDFDRLETLHLLMRSIPRHLLVATLQHTSRLTELVLGCDVAPSTGADGPPPFVELQHLRSLGLEANAWSLVHDWPGMLLMPSLHTLCIDGAALDDPRFQNMSEFFELCGAASLLATFDLRNYSLYAGDLLVLRKLESVQNLLLTACGVGSGFFDQMHSAGDACLWPNLAMITLRGMSLHKSVWQSVVALVDARNCGTRNAARPQSRLVGVDADGSCSMPSKYRNMLDDRLGMT